MTHKKVKLPHIKLHVVQHPSFKANSYSKDTNPLSARHGRQTITNKSMTSTRFFVTTFIVLCFVYKKKVLTNLKYHRQD